MNLSYVALFRKEHNVLYWSQPFPSDIFEHCDVHKLLSYLFHVCAISICLNVMYLCIDTVFEYKSGQFLK